jgi:hypothetical protein
MPTSLVATPTITIGCPAFGDYDSTVTATNVGALRIIANTLSSVATKTVLLQAGGTKGAETIAWSGYYDLAIVIESGVTTVADILATVGTARETGTPWASFSQITAGVLYSMAGGLSVEFSTLHNYTAVGTTFSNKPCLVTMACTTATAYIVYTTDGTTPEAHQGNGYRYSQPFNIYDTTTFKLIAFYPTCAYDPSATVTQTFTYAPVEAVLTCNDGTVITPTTALDIIKRALRILCVLETGEEPDAAESADCLQQLNWQVQTFANEKLMSWYLLNETFSLTAAKGNYTIGPDATKDFNTSLPISIESAFIRTTASGYTTDYPLQILANADYQQIFMKNLQTVYPRYLCFTRSYPYGTIDFWPIPSQAITLSLTQRKQFTQFTGLTSIVCLPPGYKDALAYWLAIKMSPEYGASIDAITMKLAEESKAGLKNTNYQPVLMTTDPLLKQKHRFNIFSGM